MEHTCTHCGQLCISKIPLFEPLSIEEQNDLVLKARHLDYKRGEIIFHEEDPADKILIIRYGKVKISRYSLEGKEYVLDILTEGDLYGEQNIFGGKTFEADASALGQCGVCLISLADIHELMLKKPEIGVKILNVAGRIKKELIELSRDDIAAYINIRRETISRKLGELSREGAVALEGNRKIHIRNKDILRNIFENGE